jgi:hypothetical protein
MTASFVAKVALAMCACISIALSAQIAGLDDRSPRSGKADTVDRALDYVLAKGEDWKTERKCVSCHMIPFTLWSLTEAEASGYKVPRDRFKDLTQWSLDDANRQSPGAEGLALLILSRSATGRTQDEDRYRLGYAKKLLEMQTGDGSWKPGGQTPQQKRSLAESREVVTMWSILAIDDVLKDAASDAVKKGRDFISDSTSVQSNEWTVARLLLAQRFGEKAAVTKQLDRLLRTQNKDGGWGWLEGQESDAIAAGQSLYALSLAPREKSRKAILRGRAFLTKTQLADGSWTVKGTLSQHRDRVMPTSIYWGATWAVIGLCRTVAAEKSR